MPVASQQHQLDKTVGGVNCKRESFTGERWEAYSQLLFLRARYYAPSIGRFLGRDPFSKEIGQRRSLDGTRHTLNNPYPVTPDLQYSITAATYFLYPQAQNGYNYALNNPASWHDPTGLFPQQCDPCYNSRNLTDWLVREMHTQSNNWPTWAIDVVNDTGSALLVPAAGALAQHAWETLEGVDHTLSDEARTLVEQQLALGSGLRLVGYVWWAMMVKDGARWDFKDQIKAELEESIMLGDNEGCDWYEFSMPGNIFYAYVGRVAGFSEFEIRLGAVYAQQVDPQNNPELNDWFGLDQASDQAALELGFQVYTAVGRSPSESALMAAFKTALTAKKSGLAHMSEPVAPYESPFPIGPNGPEFPLRYFDGTNCIGFFGE